MIELISGSKHSDTGCRCFTALCMSSGHNNWYLENWTKVLVQNDRRTF